MDQKEKRKSRNRLLEDSLPQFEQFIESRESYIRALEKTIEVLTREKAQTSRDALEIRSSIDELMAAHRMANIIGTATEPEQIMSTLLELTRQVIPVFDATIFLFEQPSSRLMPLSTRAAERLHKEAMQQTEAGIVDWVLAEGKTVVIPDLEYTHGEGTSRNFVIVPLLLRGQGVGIYMIHTEKPQHEFSNQDIQLLTILANQAAVGVENWRTHEQLVHTNEELKASQAQMVQAAKLAAIGELAAGIAHEIKNPLQVLMLHLELVQAGRPLPNWVDMFSKQVKRLADLTLRLMNFARNVSEDVAMEPLNINKTLDDIITMVRHEFEGTGIRFTISYAENLPPVTANSNYLQQVILNLIINARDAMPDGGGLTVTTVLTGFFVSIRIEDTGPGIPEEIRDKIFRPFFTTKGEKGTGLGLAICAKIISQHKGEIRLESEPGKGTAFTIFLPVWRTIE